MTSIRPIYLLSALVFLLAPLICARACDEPNHLVPIAPYYSDLDGYDELVYKTLIENSCPKLWMLVKPSFRPEYAVMLKKIGEKGSDTAQYELEYALAEEQIWHWRDISPGKSVVDCVKDAGVVRQRAPLNSTVAAELVDTWTAVINKTRYFETECIGLDGVTYEFFASYDRFGQTWSPETGVPRLMVDCGELLIEYAKAEDDQRGEIENQLTELLRKIREENIKSQ